MNEIKDYFKSIIKSYKRFPIFLLITSITCIFISIVLGTDFISEKNLRNILVFSLLLGSSFLLIESGYKKQDIKKLILSVIATCISGIITKYVFLNTIIGKAAISYFLICLILSFYNLFKNSKKKLGEYITYVFINLFEVGIVNSVLSIGILFISAIINTLLFDSEITFVRLEILLLGFYYIPSILNSFVKVNDKHLDFFNSLIKYVLFGILLVSYVVMYAYLIKILITKTLPINEVFPIVSILFFNSAFIWLMVSHINENKINKLLPFLFIPFVILQSYCLGIRIYEYGVTPQRYVGVMIIIVEVVFLMLYLIKKEYAINTIFIIITLIIIGVNTPGLNAEDISYKSQYNRLRVYNEKENLTKEDKKQIYSAYVYLNETDKGKEYIRKCLTYNNTRIVKTFEQIYEPKENYIYFKDTSLTYNISGYNSIEEIFETKYDINKTITEVFKDVKIGTAKIDMTNKVNEYINNKDDDNYFVKNNEIKINKKSKLIIKQISIDLDEKKNVNYYEIGGYLLKK